MHEVKSGSGSGGGPLWSILIGSQGTLLCRCLTCMMGRLDTPTTNSGPGFLVIFGGCYDVVLVNSRT